MLGVFSLKPQMLSGSARISLGVSTGMFLVNHGQAFVEGHMDASRWLSVGLGYMVPLLLSFYCPCADSRKTPCSQTNDQMTDERAVQKQVSLL